MTALLALDQGTSSTRAIVFDLAGKILAVAQEELTQYYPQKAWVEHDPDEIWQTQFNCAKQAIDQAKQPIEAIGITNQRETVVVWERASGKAIHPAIVWQDRRCTAICQELRAAGHEERIYEKTGLLLDPYFSASKIAWILDHVDGARAQAEAGLLACGTIDSWLLFQLSQHSIHATDVSNASRTSLMNIQTGQWDPELLEIFNVPASLLPEIRPSADYFCQCSLFGDAIPVSGIAGDQQAALFGQHCFEAGMIKSTYGTGAFIMMQTGLELKRHQGLLSTVAWQIKDQAMHYALEGAVFSAGSAVQWLRDELGIIQTASEIETLAAAVQDSNDVFFIPAFTGLATPYWDPQARACIVGITRDSNKSHIARASLDAIAHQVCDVITGMQTQENISLIRVDGGAAENNLLMQLQANLAHVDVLRPQQCETTALGAAWLAAIGADLCSLDELHWQLDTRFTPQIDDAQRTSLRQRWDQAVQRSLQWAEDDPHT